MNLPLTFRRPARRTAVVAAAAAVSPRRTPLTETLEPRTLCSAAPVFSPLAGLTKPVAVVQPLASPVFAQPLGQQQQHFAHPLYDVLHQRGGGASTNAGIYGFDPEEIRKAYGFDGLRFGSAAADGTGQTIAIVDAFDDPTIGADLAAFDAAYGLAPPPSFRQVAQDGSRNLPSADSGWAMEIALDVEWAHALAPGANILLVEANDNSYASLMSAVDYARQAAGVSVVSMSWGGSEFAGETDYDGIFSTPSGHQGVTFFASTGDNGAPGGFPAASSNVVAVGGTSLQLNADGSYAGESGWSGSGGGVSLYESRPQYQSGLSTPQGNGRMIPDVSFDADPNTGVAVYDSYGTYSPWLQVGGTSFSSPAWAALGAVINQGRAVRGLGTLDGRSATLPMLYQLAGRDFHDVTTGGNGFDATGGYDLVTGLGTPNVKNLMADLFGQQQAPVTVGISGPSSATAGQTYTLNLASQNGQGLRSWTINWGDGVTQTLTGNPSTASHVFGRGGTTYAITASASDDTNTYDAGSVSVSVAQPKASADLAVRFIAKTVPGRVHAKQSVSVKVRLSNLGAARAAGRAAVLLYASPDGSLGDAVLLTTSRLRVSLAANRSQDVALSFRMPASLAGATCKLIAVISPASAIGDSNAADDVTVSTRTITVLGASRRGAVAAVQPAVEVRPAIDLGGAGRDPAARLRDRDLLA